MASTRIRVVDRVVDILSCFSISSPELGVTEIGKMLELDKATVCRILLTLESRGFVRSNPLSRRYSIGPKLLELARVGAENVAVSTEALPHMRWLRDQTGETVLLSIRLGFEYVYAQQLESTHEIRRTVQIGRSGPLHCAAPGKVILAYLPEEEIERFFSTMELVRFTDRTVTDPVVLRASLKEIRARGYALSCGERIPGSISFAAPVWDHTAAVVASMAVSLPSTRYTPERNEEYAMPTRVAAERLSAALGAPRPPA